MALDLCLPCRLIGSVQSSETARLCLGQEVCEIISRPGVPDSVILITFHVSGAGGGRKRDERATRRNMRKHIILCNTVSVQFDFRAADQYYAVQVRRAASCLVSTTSS
ncbi:hypothetical protein ZEAMMB73_Zm00001d022260 [Zea mays]|uniref:Uncharacterized protein n=1 Tax=Zea mays TaxID=4577 RepID=A0A1D6IKP4_MAIZE|nr:hypothetical protein ZEAMMB73_Zm00001d022260 [Zea mays]